MRDIVNLVDARAAQRFRWVTPGQILERDPQLEAQAATCDEFWYDRNLVWLTARQQLQRNNGGAHPILASYFATPENDWTLAQALMNDRSPELVFYRRRRAGTCHQECLLRKQMNGAKSSRRCRRFGNAVQLSGRLKAIWHIPPDFRGRLVRLEFDAAASELEAFSVRLRFFDERRKQKKPFLLRPYLTADGGTDFFALQIPATSTGCEIQLRFAEKTERVEFRRVRAFLENADIAR